MDNQTNIPTQQPQAPTPKKGGHTGLITSLILLVVLIAVLVVFSKKKEAVDEAAATPATTQEQDVQDIGDIEAELDATAFEGVSDGL